MIDIFSFLIQIIIILMALKELKKSILDIGGLLSILFIVFYCFPAWDYILGWNLINHEYVFAFGVGHDRTTESRMLLFASFTFLCFIIGYSTKVVWGKDKNEMVSCNVSYSINTRNYTIIQLFLFLCICFVIFYEFILYGGNIISFLLPSRKAIAKSEIMDSVQYIFPLVMFSLAAIKNRGCSNKFIRLLPFYFICLLTNSIGAQRRDMMASLIYIVIFSMAGNLTELNAKGMSLFQNRKIRKRIIRLGIFALCCIPLFWYARTFSSQFARGNAIIKPWEIRGFTELIFGSSSSGFETLLILNSYKDTINIPFGHTLLFIICMYVPRSLWPSKPMTITMTLMNKLGMQGNLSLFMINDLLISFDFIAPLVALIWGMILSSLYKKKIMSDDIFCFSNGVFILASIILLFKNGVSQFMFDYLMFSIITSFIYRIVRVKVYE